MKAFLAITLAVACLVAGALAQEPLSQVLTPAGQHAFVSSEYAQLRPEEEESVRNKRQFGFGGGYGRGYGGGYGRGFGGGYGGYGGGYGRGFGGGYGGYGGYGR